MTIQTMTVTAKSDDNPAKLIERLARRVDGWNHPSMNYSVSTRTTGQNKLVITVRYDPTVIRLPYHLIGGMTDELLALVLPDGYSIDVS